MGHSGLHFAHAPRTLRSVGTICNGTWTNTFFSVTIDHCTGRRMQRVRLQRAKHSGSRERGIVESEA
jgi:hypothetical protein